jgi:threonine dehydratase
MFFKKDDVFAGQGATLAEALEQATQRFPGILFSVEQ